MFRHTLKMMVFMFFLVLVGCSSGDTNVRVSETGAEPSRTVTETIRLNNCGGKADTEQIAERSHTVSIVGEGQIGIGYQILVASVSAKYAQSRGSSKSQKLVAPPGTNMEFTLAWAEQGWTGTITAEGKSGQATYRVRVPIAVELVSSRDLGCGVVSQPPASAPPPTARPVAPVQQTAIVSLKYDDTGGIQFAQGQTQLVAIYLQRVQAGGSLEEAIQSIKQQAANARATVQEGNSISIPSLQAYFVWCPNADCVYPTNTSFPLKGFRQDYSKVAVIEVGENRTVQCPSNCWAVAVR